MTSLPLPDPGGRPRRTPAPAPQQVPAAGARGELRQLNLHGVVRPVRPRNPEYPRPRFDLKLPHHRALQAHPPLQG